MSLFVTPQFRAAFKEQPPVGLWVERKFFDWKFSGLNTPAIFGRDVPDLRPNFANLHHVHLIPSAPSEMQAWVIKARNPSTDPFYLTSDRFLLYAQHSSGSCLLIDYYVDVDPGGHKRLPRYFGTVQDPFVADLRLPPGCVVYTGNKKTA